MLFVLMSCLSFTTSNVLVVMLLALEEQLAPSRHETEEAYLREVLLKEEHERAVVIGVWQGASIALAAMQLRTGRDFLCHHRGCCCGRCGRGGHPLRWWPWALGCT